MAFRAGEWDWIRRALPDISYILWDYGRVLVILCEGSRTATTIPVRNFAYMLRKERYRLMSRVVRILRKKSYECGRYYAAIIKRREVEALENMQNQRGA